MKWLHFSVFFFGKSCAEYMCFFFLMNRYALIFCEANVHVFLSKDIFEARGGKKHRQLGSLQDGESSQRPKVMQSRPVPSEGQTETTQKSQGLQMARGFTSGMLVLYLQDLSPPKSTRLDPRWVSFHFCWKA